eukprot:2162792-Amphidinium_carterae.1
MPCRKRIHGRVSSPACTSKVLPDNRAKPMHPKSQGLSGKTSKVFGHKASRIFSKHPRLGRLTVWTLPDAIKLRLHNV